MRPRQFYNSKLQLVKDVMEPHALECVDFARAVAEGDSFAGAARAVAPGHGDSGWHLSQPD